MADIVAPLVIAAGAAAATLVVLLVFDPPPKALFEPEEDIAPAPLDPSPVCIVTPPRTKYRGVSDRRTLYCVKVPEGGPISLDFEAGQGVSVILDKDCTQRATWCPAAQDASSFSSLTD